MLVVLMGVSGSGKTTIGQLLAEPAGALFADADDYHPLANKQKMAAGQPLNDADRQPWLESLNRLLRGWYEAGLSGAGLPGGGSHDGSAGGVLACSALKEAYRATLTGELPAGAVTFVLLDGSKELIAERLAHRHHEFMSTRLLDSQFATLEPPADALRVVNDRPPEQVVSDILHQMNWTG